MTLIHFHSILGLYLHHHINSFSSVELIEIWAASLTSCIIGEHLKHTRAGRGWRPPQDAATHAAIGAGDVDLDPLLGWAGVGCWAESWAIRSDPWRCWCLESFPSVAGLVCEQEGRTNRERKQNYSSTWNNNNINFKIYFL